MVVDETITIRIFGESGDVLLFDGPFSPEGTGTTVPFEDYLVTIPGNFSGSADIQAAATVLVGVSMPFSCHRCNKTDRRSKAAGTPTTESSTIPVTVVFA